MRWPLELARRASDRGSNMGTRLLEKARDSAAIADLPDEFRWVLWLSPGNLQEFQKAVSVALKSNLSDEQVAELLGDWRATAELDAAPEVLAEIRRPKHYEPLSKFANS